MKKNEEQKDESKKTTLKPNDYQESEQMVLLDDMMDSQCDIEENITILPSQKEILEKDIWFIEDVCSLFKITRGTVYNLLYKGKLPKHKIGGKLIFYKDEVLNLMR